MDPMFGKAAVLAAIAVMLAVRAPHVRRAARVAVVRSEGGRRDAALVALVGVGLLVLPLAWIFTPLLRAADHALLPTLFAAGVVVHAGGFWLLHRSHADLGTNWSNTLQLREGHGLVSHGVYRRIRHPMYSALLLFGLGQALVTPNWIAGPAFLVAFGILTASRLRPEERMMRERFGADYDAYRARTRRLVPGVF